MASPHYLSARTSKGLVPRDQLRTIQAESIAARKPRAIPVPIGQKGCKGDMCRVKVTQLLKEGRNPVSQGPTITFPLYWYNSCKESLFTHNPKHPDSLVIISSCSLPPSVLTSRRLSPTRATSNWCPFCSRTKAAFSEAYMQVKSNMATSGCP